VRARGAGVREVLRSSAGLAGAVDGGRIGRGAQPPSDGCDAHRHKEVVL
jgi:hypothetical protein